MDPGQVELLEGIAEIGSIAAAGRRMGMTSKRAWLLVEEMNAIVTGRCPRWASACCQPIATLKPPQPKPVCATSRSCSARRPGIDQHSQPRARRINAVPSPVGRSPWAIRTRSIGHARI